MAVKEKGSSVLVAGKRITLSHLDRVMFPRAKITKEDVVAYYKTVASYMLALVKGHAITIQRYPEGITKEGFYQKDMPDYVPAWIKRVSVKKKEGGIVHYAVANSPATFVYLANQGVITFHAMLSKADKISYPDRMIFDLDPSQSNFDQIREAALLLKSLLDEHDLVSFVMTTGSRGLHVVVPLKRRYTFNVIAQCARYFARKMIEHDPKRYTLELRKNQRGKRIFIDTLRNGEGAISVIPYSIRTKEYAPIALPVSWKEVNNAGLKPDGCTIKDMKKIRQSYKIWQKFSTTANNLAPLVALLKKTDKKES